jgi:uncharacterized membrane protein
MQFKRIAKHLLFPASRVGRAFPRASLAAVEQAIAASERRHTGEIRFVVEGALDGVPLFKDVDARQRAIEVFSQLRIWDTEANNGVLIYLLLADRDVEIVADRGAAAKVDPESWEDICRTMESAFRNGDFEGGVLRGIEAVTTHLAKHFPTGAGDRNELPDRPVLLAKHRGD